jgi:hypothetical protein
LPDEVVPVRHQDWSKAQNDDRGIYLEAASVSSRDVLDEIERGFSMMRSKEETQVRARRSYQ